MIRDEFKVHKLNESGMKKAEALALCFSELLNYIEAMCGKEGRMAALVKTKLEEASFFAKKAIASQAENQVGWIEPSLNPVEQIEQAEHNERFGP